MHSIKPFFYFLIIGGLFVIGGCRKNHNTIQKSNSIYPITDTFIGLYNGHLENAFAGAGDTMAILQAYIIRTAADTQMAICPYFYGDFFGPGGNPVFSALGYDTVALSTTGVSSNPDISVKISGDSLMINHSSLIAATLDDHTFAGRKK